MKLILIICLCLFTTQVYPMSKVATEELALRQIADRLEGNGQRTWQQAVIRTREYVHKTMKSKQGEDPYALLSIYERLKTGVGWCNHQADAFMLLISYMGITSRLVYLMDGEVSPHTIAEIYDGSRWVIVDVGNNLDLRTKDGLMATRLDISKDFTILTENERVKELGYDKDYLKMYTNEAQIIKYVKGDRWQLGERRRF